MHESGEGGHRGRDITKTVNDLKRVLVNSDLRFLEVDQISYPFGGNCPEGLGPLSFNKLSGEIKSYLHVPSWRQEGVGWPRAPDSRNENRNEKHVAASTWLQARNLCQCKSNRNPQLEFL